MTSMSKLTFLGAAIAAPFILIGCVAADYDPAAKAAKTAPKGEIVSITPEIRAEIERQGENPDEEICKREEQMGSTIPKRICATRAAWEAKRQASKNATEEYQRNGLKSRDPGAGG
jgi:hypothetical protein